MLNSTFVLRIGLLMVVVLIPVALAVSSGAGQVTELQGREDRRRNVTAALDTLSDGERFDLLMACAEEHLGCAGYDDCAASFDRLPPERLQGLEVAVMPCIERRLVVREAAAALVGPGDKPAVARPGSVFTAEPEPEAGSGDLALLVLAGAGGVVTVLFGLIGVFLLVRPAPEDGVTS